MSEPSGDSKKRKVTEFLGNTRSRLSEGTETILKNSLNLGKDGARKMAGWGTQSQAYLGTLMAQRLTAITSKSDRLDIAAWLAVVRAIVADSSQSTLQKTKDIYAICDMKETGGIAIRTVTEAAKSIKDSDFPLALKIAIPATLAASSLIAGQGVGIAGFGTAIGLPALLLVFLGVAGITSTIEGLLGSKSVPSYLALVAALIAKDEVLRRIKKEMREAMVQEPLEPKKYKVDATSAADFFDSLYALSPSEFERHVMAYFNGAGYFSWVTKASNDFGVDGFAKHPKGLIIVQCKRYTRDHAIGRPLVQQFKGVVEEQNAWKGFVVCTSRFTAEARESALLNNKVQLIDLNDLFAWSQGNFCVD
jgi:restriction system protein